MTPEIVTRLSSVVALDLPVRPGSSTWLNLDTGARMLHARFGDKGVFGEFHGVYYVSPAGDILDITYPVAELCDYEQKLGAEEGESREAVRDVNAFWIDRVEHAVEKVLGLRDDEFQFEEG